MFQSICLDNQEQVNKNMCDVTIRSITIYSISRLAKGSKLSVRAALSLQMTILSLYDMVVKCLALLPHSSRVRYPMCSRLCAS